MPSQNLPKPNLPGQNQTVFNSSSASTSDIPSESSVKPVQIRQSQVVPGGLSRENPGGTPPSMRVAAPAATVAPIETKAQAQSQSIVSSQPPVQSQQPTLMNRPVSPLGQLSLKDSSSAAPAPAAPAPAPAASQTRVDSQTPAASQPSTVNQAAPVSQVDHPADSKKPELNGGNPSIIGKIKGKLPLPALIGIGVLAIVLVGVLIFSLFKPKTSTNTSTKSTGTNTTGADSVNTAPTAQVTTLTYWGLWEDSQILKEVIADFEKKNPSIKIDYRKQSHRDYRERLQQAILSGNGPDIFRYHVDWVPMLSADLSTMPSSIMSAAEYKQIFYPTAYNNLQVGGQIVGIPLMYDGLALFYNKEMLKTANIEVPTTWAELRTAANKLTVPANVSERQSGNITRAGLAIGNAGNVDHFSDILALLIIQNGGNPAVADSQYVKDAITFYTNFIKQDKIWSDRLASSTTAFARGDVAMIFAPSWRVHDVKNLNPNLDFAVARVPQLDSEKPAAWATFWAEGVSGKSKNKDAAWSFLKYLSTPEVLRKFYNDASQYRAFGEIYPRTDMAAELQGNELVAAYVADAPIAKSWYMSSFTHDNGLNDQIIKYYEDAVNAVLSSTNVEKALETTVTGVNSVLTKYSSK